MKPFICLITGPAGVGKSTIAERLSEKFERSARVDVDYLRHSIRNGKVRPYPYTEEAHRQILLATKNSCDLAKNFCDEGFSVFIDDVAVLKDKIDAYFENTSGYDFYIFVLICGRETLRLRDSGRSIDQQMGARCLELLDEYEVRFEEEKRWKVMDTDNKSIDQIVEEILKLI